MNRAPFVLALVAGCASPPPSIPPLPTPQDVERMTATLFSVPGGKIEDPSPFVIPRANVADVLRALGEPKYDDTSRGPYEHLAEIAIACKDGRQFRVELIFWGKSPVHYRLDGINCFRSGPYLDSKPGFDNYLPESYTMQGLLWAVQRNDQHEIRQAMEALDRSAGRPAPLGNTPD